MGEGGCGVIYEVLAVAEPHKRFAIKAEQLVEEDEPTLPMEVNIIRQLNEIKSAHVVKLLDSGKVGKYNFIVMSLLGPSIDMIRVTIPLKKFSLHSCLFIMLQCFDSIAEVHSIGFIHRDVKPANFAIGALGTPKQRVVHILDFGIARAFMVKTPEQEMRIRKPRTVAPFRGTPKYCSIGTHGRKEQGRHDDLWSLFYMLIEMYRGMLPWAGMTDIEQIHLKKLDNKEMVNGLLPEFVLFSKHLSCLSYAAKPDYNLLRTTLCNVYIENKFGPHVKVDWEKGGIHDRLFAKKTSMLPLVYERDTSPINIDALLKIPKKVTKLVEEDFTKIPATDDMGLNTQEDDTLVEEEKNEKKTKKGPPAAPKKYTYKPRKEDDKNAKLQEEKWKKRGYAAAMAKRAQNILAEHRATQDVIAPEGTLSDFHDVSGHEPSGPPERTPSVHDNIHTPRENSRYNENNK